MISESTRFLGQPRVIRYRLFFEEEESTSSPLSKLGPLEVINAPSETIDISCRVADRQIQFLVEIKRNHTAKRAGCRGPLQDTERFLSFDRIESQAHLLS